MAVNKIRQLGNKSVPKLLEKIAYTDIVTDVTAGGTGVPVAAEVAKALYSQSNTETSNRINADLEIIGTATADYSTLGKIETVVKANKAEEKQDIVDTKVYVDGKVSAEETARINADADLRTAIDQEIADRVTAVSNEASARTSADNTLQSNLSQEVSDRTLAITNEANTRVAADNSLQANIDAEIEARIGAISAEELARKASDDTLDGKITTEKQERQADVTNLTASINAERSARVAADSVQDQRLSMVESGYVTGAKLKGTVDNLAGLDVLDESVQEEGWFYKVKSGTTGTQDVYMVASGVTVGSYDYQPAGWSTKGFIWLMDFADVSNAVAIEKSARQAADAELDGKITVLDGKVDGNKQLSDAAIATLRTDMENADSVLDTRITNEVNDRTTAVSNEVSARTAADNVITANLNGEIAARESAIANEQTARTEADTILQGNIDAEATARQTAVSNEATARSNADTQLQGAIDQEVSDRQTAITTEQGVRSAADSALSARLDIVEGSDLVDGSIKKALLDAKKYADMYIPLPNLEGNDDNLLIVGDTVTLAYAPYRGLSGVAMGEVIVYFANGDSAMVTVLNVVGNQLTLATETAGEYDGLKVKVQYWFINADQNGAGLGVAGEGGAGM